MEAIGAGINHWICDGIGSAEFRNLFAALTDERREFSEFTPIPSKAMNTCGGWWNQSASPKSVGVLVLSQWSRLGLERIDFGTGKPVHGVPICTDPYCFLLPVYDQPEGGEVRVFGQALQQMPRGLTWMTFAHPSFNCPSERDSCSSIAMRAKWKKKRMRRLKRKRRKMRQRSK